MINNDEYLESGKKIDEYIHYDIGRPTFYTDPMRDYWRSVHSLIKESPIKILTNPIFTMMEEHLNSDSSYMGSCYKYYFWFETEEDRAEFEKQFKAIKFEENE